MFSFTNTEKVPNITCYCDCGRVFIQEEMYCCLHCHNAFCRYCCAQDIHVYFCRNCLENPSNTETFTFKSTCGNCVECPICKNILTITVCSESRKLHFYCQFCFWNSKSIGLQEEKIEELLTACANKTKDNVDPKQTEFQRLQSIYKQSEQEIEKAKKLYLRIKRKSISLVLPNLISKDLHKKVWSPSDFERETALRAEQLIKRQGFIDKTNVKSFKLEKAKNDEDKSFLFKTSDVYKDFYEDSYCGIDEELAAAYDTAAGNFFDRFYRVFSLEFTGFDGSDQRGAKTQFPNEPASVCEVRKPLSFAVNLLNSALLPKPLTLLTRKSKKCRKCQKFVVKFEKSSSVFLDFRISSFLIDHCPKVLIKTCKYVDEPEKSCEISLTFTNNSKYNLLVYLETLDEDQTKALKLREALILDNYEFKMDSVENLEHLKIKREKEKAKEEGASTPEGGEKRSSPAAKVIEPEPVKTLVPIRVELNDEDKLKPLPLKFGLKVQLKVEIETEMSTLGFTLIVAFPARKV